MWQQNFYSHSKLLEGNTESHLDFSLMLIAHIKVNESLPLLDRQGTFPSQWYSEQP